MQSAIVSMVDRSCDGNSNRDHLHLALRAERIYSHRNYLTYATKTQSCRGYELAKA